MEKDCCPYCGASEESLRVVGKNAVCEICGCKFKIEYIIEN